MAGSFVLSAPPDAALRPARFVGFADAGRPLGFFPPLWSNGERAGDDGTILSFDQVFRSQPVVRTAVDKIAKRIATLPFDAFDRTANDGRELDSSSSLASLIHQPWPRAGAVHLNHFIAQSLLVHGNALVAKLRTADREAPPFMLWPLIGRRSVRGGLSVAVSSGGRRSSSTGPRGSSRLRTSCISRGLPRRVPRSA
jgi:hypothetical protein